MFTAERYLSELSDFIGEFNLPKSRFLFIFNTEFFKEEINILDLLAFRTAMFPKISLKSGHINLSFFPVFLFFFKT